MPFTTAWDVLLEELDDLPADAEFITPLSHDRFRITDVQPQRVVIQSVGAEDKRPLQRDQFETLYHRIQDAHDGFALDRLPPDADPYPAVWSLHPRFEIDADAGTIGLTDEPTAPSQLVDADAAGGSEEATRSEPEGLDIYADALLLVDALERHDVTDLSVLDTETLVNLYTLLSDVQRDANAFRTEVADVLLGRVHHDRPVSGQYGSVQRTTRRNRSLKDDEEVLAVLEDVGIEPERVLGVDRDKVDDALEVTELSERAVYEIDDTEYVRKADVDEDVKESHLQGLKDRLAAAEDQEADELRQEIEELETRIDELTSFRTGTEMYE